MSVFNKIANFVGVEFEEKPKVVVENKPIAEAVLNVEQATPVAPVAPTVLSENDSEYVKMLESALKDASNSTPSNFYKFLLIVDSLTSIMPDEMSRFKAAWATTSATSELTIASLITSADDFIKTLDEENKNFEDVVNNAIIAKVTSRQAEVDKITADKTDKLAQITRLTEEMNVLTEQELAIKNEMESARFNIEIKKNNFASAMYKVKLKLVNAKANVEKYLKEIK